MADAHSVEHPVLGQAANGPLTDAEETGNLARREQAGQVGRRRGGCWQDVAHGW